MYDLLANNLYVFSFLNELLELICLHIVKIFQALLFNINNFIYEVFLCNMNYFPLVYEVK